MITELIHRYQPGFSLEQAFYTDSAIFELDLAQVFAAHWQYAGHVSRLPNPGDYFLYNFGRESIIITRAEDGQVHALFNVCRHRGSRICLERRVGQKLVCPYHAWVYAPDGSLIAARHMPEAFDKQAYGLARAHVQVAEGLIFICLAATPPAFDTFAEDIAWYFAPHQLPQAKIAHRVSHIAQANWKLVAENFWECYHCGPTHPEFCSVMSYGRAIDSPRLARERAEFEVTWAQHTQSLGHHTGRTDRFLDGGIHFTSRIPIRPGYCTQSVDGQPVAPLMGDFKQFDGSVTSTMRYPLLWFVACNDHAMLARFTPISPQQTELEFTWLVRADAVAGVDYDPLAVSWLWRITAEQDKTICENNQAGVNSRRYQPGPYSPVETSTRAFVDWYLRQLRQAPPSGDGERVVA